MTKTHEACQECRYAAVCYGLGLRVVLQMLVDEAQHPYFDAIPSACPEYDNNEWHIGKVGESLVVLRNGDTVSIPYGHEKTL